MTELERFSASGLKKFDECPKKFWYYYLSDVEIPETEEPVHFKVGNAVHESIENVLGRDDAELSDANKLYDQFLEEEEEIGYDYGDDQRDKVENCLEIASQFVAGRVEKVHSIEEEMDMEYTLKDFTGYIDLVADVVINDTTFENSIIDWKTGQKNTKREERLQGGTYLEMYYQEYGEYPDALMFVYLDEGDIEFHNRIVDGEVMWNEHENSYWEDVDSVFNSILKANKNDRWVAKPETANCYFCDYKYACPDYTGSEELKPHHIQIGGTI